MWLDIALGVSMWACLAGMVTLLIVSKVKKRKRGKDNETVSH